MKGQVEIANNLFSDTEMDANSPSRLAAYLRVLGALAVVSSGVIYMLQGLHSVDVNLRYWTYIALMLVLSTGGIFSFKLVQDRKGARLFFGLATAMVPIQFSQLGGMVFNYVGGNHGDLLEIFRFASGSLAFLLWMGGISLVVSAAASFAGFSILCRSHAKKLFLAFALINLSILWPFRDFPLGLLIVGGLVGTIFLLERNLFIKDAVFKTFEGIAVRAIFLLPLAIVAVRFGFYENSLLGISLLAGIVSFALALFARYWFNTGRRYECLLFAAYVVGLLASSGISMALLPTVSKLLYLSTSMEIFTCIAPAACWSAYLSYQSKMHRMFYRTIAIIAVLFMSYLMLLEMTAGGLFSTCLTGAVLVIWGVHEKARLTVVAGVILSAGSLAGLLWLSISSITTNVWLVLALVGIAFVALSSVLEKYGRQWVNSGREHLAAFSHWNN